MEKNNKRSFLSWLMVIVLLSMGFFCSSALAAIENAAEYIAFYSQARGATWNSSKGVYSLGYWDKEMAKRGVYVNQESSDKYPGIVNDGCDLLSYVHITQYLTNKCATTDDQLDLLEEYARLAEDPSTASAESAYDSHLISQYGNQGITRTNIGKVPSFSTFQTFFDNGGAAHINIPGHFFIVVGCTEKDGKQYLLAVDSSYNSTIKRLKSQTAYQVGTFSKMEYSKITKDGSAKQYWIEYNDFKNSNCTVHHAYMSSKRASSGMSPYESFSFQNVVYPERFKINTTNGWDLSGGELVCDKKLKTIKTEIKTADGKTTISGPRSYNISGYKYLINSLDTRDGTNNGVRFSFIKSTGNYIWVLTATDETNRELVLEMPIKAVTNESTAKATISKTYSSGGQTVTAIEGVYKFNKNDESRSGPAEAYDKVSDYGKDAIVFVEGKVVNQYNNTWYKLSDGSYVWDGDVDKVTLTETSLSGSYEYTTAGKSKVWPYAASKTITSYSKGDTVTVTAKVTNSYGNVWYKISDSSYVYSGDVVSTSMATTLRFKNVDYPSVYIISANGWWLCGGTVESDYELTSIKSEIKKGSTVVSTKTRTISGKKYSISSLDTGASTEDNGVRFSYIKSKGYGAGQYTWNITATDAKGRTLTLTMPFEAKTSGTEVKSTKSLSYDDPNRSVTAITIRDEYGTDYTGIDMLEHGFADTSENLLLYAYVSPADATNTKVAWTSSDNNILKLVGTEDIAGGTIGIFSRTGVGSATVTATAQDGSGKNAAVYYHYYMSEMGLDTPDSSIQVNQTMRIQPVLVPAVAYNSSLTWSSSNPAVASVDDDGIVKGVSPGWVTITATANDGSGLYAACGITVTINGTDISEDSYTTVTIEEAYEQKYYRFVPAQTTTYSFISEGEADAVGYIYDSGMNEIAMNDDGRSGLNFQVNAVLTAGQTYYLGAKMWSQSTGSYQVCICKHIPVAGISYGCLDLMPGETGSLYANCYAENWISPTNPEVYYEPVNNDICSVSWDGYVEARSPGIVGVTIYSKDNPEITERTAVFVHGEMDYSINANIDSQGRFVLSFDNVANTDDLLYGFYISSNSLVLPFQYVSGNIDGLSTKTAAYDWENGNGKIGQYFGVFSNSDDNTVSTDKSVTFTLLASNIEELWGTTQDYTFTFAPIFFCEGRDYGVYGVSKELSITVAYPAIPSDFITPAALTVIDDEAFYGVKAKHVRISDKVTTIGNLAFAYCNNLKSIYIPASCTDIAADAFYGDSGLIIYSQSGSYAETYANAKGFTFKQAYTLAERIKQYMLSGAEYKAYNASLDLNGDGVISSADYVMAKNAE